MPTVLSYQLVLFTGGGSNDLLVSLSENMETGPDLKKWIGSLKGDKLEYVKTLLQKDAALVSKLDSKIAKIILSELEKLSDV